jgi:hypothetical protein
MKNAIRQDRIDTLLELAKRAEAIEASKKSHMDKVDGFFTCNRVSNELGWTFAEEYQKRFFPKTAGRKAECDLWSDPLCMSRRILSLCFMAAMVEAGDA